MKKMFVIVLCIVVITAVGLLHSFRFTCIDQEQSSEDILQSSAEESFESGHMYFDISLPELVDTGYFNGKVIVCDSDIESHASVFLLIKQLVTDLNGLFFSADEWILEVLSVKEDVSKGDCLNSNDFNLLMSINDSACIISLSDKIGNTIRAMKYEQTDAGSVLISWIYKDIDDRLQVDIETVATTDFDDLMASAVVFVLTGEPSSWRI